MSGELKPSEIIEGLGKAFEEFKKTNNERLALLEKGKTDPLVEEKIAKLNDAMNELGEMKQRVEELETKGNRPGEGVDGESRIEKQHKEAFFAYARRKETGALEALDGQKDLRVGSETDGGFWVPPTMSGKINELIYPISPMRQLANIETVGTDRLIGMADINQGDAGWVGEEDTRSDSTTPAMGEYEIPVREMYSMPKATQQSLDDAQFDIEGWLIRRIGRKMARLEGEAFTTGNGEKRPRGFLAYSTVADASWSASTWGQIGYIASGASGDFAASDPQNKLIDLVDALEPEYLPRAVFQAKRTVISDIRKFQDGDGNMLWRPGLQFGKPDTLLGYPVVSNENMPAKAANSLSVAFGDFAEGYTIVERSGFRLLRDPFTTKGYVKFYATRRVGGGVVNFQAIKVMKFASS